MLHKKLAVCALSAFMTACAHTIKHDVDLKDGCLIRADSEMGFDVKYDTECGKQVYNDSRREVEQAEANHNFRVLAAQRTEAWRTLAVRAGVSTNNPVEEALFSRMLLQGAASNDPEMRKVAQEVMTSLGMNLDDLTAHSKELDRLAAAAKKVCIVTNTGIMACGQPEPPALSQ